ncbi:hypothetical protein C5748_16815 [Phyllobacterium phragmitis]|uniref:Uncharacterized protein n=1 Tax=Phyllobacterium phragmitis TaxID=2670329 RepID=A0A2S9IPI3_9HYPH|nr:hypothetical protein [Phyllobacterium phragmitis]PRD42441.1 hypothetical protein C5748_16815 [Phyllobacterium phragmitis]
MTILAGIPGFFEASEADARKKTIVQPSELQDSGREALFITRMGCQIVTTILPNCSFDTRVCRR